MMHVTPRPIEGTGRLRSSTIKRLVWVKQMRPIRLYCCSSSGKPGGDAYAVLMPVFAIAFFTVGRALGLLMGATALER